MSDGKILKPDKDFSKEVDKQIPEAQELAKVVYPLVNALETLLIIRVLGQYSSST